MEDRKTYFVDVVLPLAVHNTFTYRVPYELNDTLKKGVRVVVPFGRAKLQTGIVIRIHEEIPTAYQAKYVESVLDDEPIITGSQYQLWQWISQYYMAPIGDVMNAALPSNFKLGSETKIVLHPEAEVNSELLSDREYQVFDALDIQGELTLKDISDILQIQTIQPVIKALIDKRVVITTEELNVKYTPKTQAFVTLTEDFQDQDNLEVLLNDYSSSKRKAKQVDAVLTFLKLGGFKQNVSVPIAKKVLEEHDVSASSLQTLEKDGVFEIQRMEVSRISGFDKIVVERKALSEAQQTALDEVKASFEEKDVALLHGVTGSGKTEIYVELIQEQIDAGKQVLFLIPEIALTTQLIDRLSNYFGDRIGVYHSRFNQNERIEIWNSMLKGDMSRFSIIVGARSAVFLPFKNLGLVIVDEEHESSFKQYDPSPRYNGRDVAIVLSSLHKAKVLLGSATPSFESYYNATEGKYGLIELHKRFGDVLMPEIMTANLKREKRDKTMRAEFSSFLMEHIETALQNKEQVILFQNRRGYNPVWACEVCGWTPECKNCDVSLTYHKHKNVLSCHYCGYYTPPVGACPSCGSNRLKMIGFGTEKIEDELSILLPKAKVQRLDLDTTRQKNSYQRILTEFDNREIDILVGTQMVTKGLDFDNVSLVGILDADAMLRRPDFRAFERSYQLMSQVAGRAGRKSKRGTVIVQTMDPDNWVIRHVMDHDFIGFYKNEIIERKNYAYPPFFKIIQFTIKHRKAEDLSAISAEFADELRKLFGDRVLGPEFPPVQRIHNYYLKVVRLKLERNANQVKVKNRVQELINTFFATPRNKSCRIQIDVDPM
ncbi:MAG: primosomal protein N' [Crocinitomicaceae bacterium]|nr:primosomal protein N' [Crocinitomicaceae bacterium]